MGRKKNKKRTFEDGDDLLQHLGSEEGADVTLYQQVSSTFPGVVEQAVLTLENGRLRVFIEFEALGLDADGFMCVSHSYEFASMDEFRDFLEQHCGKTVQQLRPWWYTNTEGWPTPYDAPEQLSRYGEGWDALQEAHREGRLRIPGIRCVH